MATMEKSCKKLKSDRKQKYRKCLAFFIKEGTIIKIRHLQVMN